MLRDKQKASWLRSTVLYLIDDVRISAYLIVFVAVVTISGFLYYFLTPLGHGMGRDLTPLHETSFSNGMYFSLVTISSLGYSDMHPMGFSKVLACIEVLMGMALSGLLIARIASRRLSFHVSRMYGSHTRDYLDRMSVNFEEITEKLRRWGADYSTVFDAIGSKNNVRKRTDIFRNLIEIAIALENHMKSLHEYVNKEVNESDYFRNAPAESIIRLGKSLDSSFSGLVQILIGLSTHSRLELLSGNVREMIGNSARSMNEISAVVYQHKRASDNPDVRGVFENIGRVCSSLFNHLGEAPEWKPPDQIGSESYDPRPIDEADDESARMG